MYSSGYAQVNKLGPEAQKKMQYHSKGKSCGYYMRIVFFFSSLIQSLIIVSLVLFLVYGKTQDSATRIQDLEERFSQLSIENVDLRKQRANLTNLLNVTLTNKARNDWDLAQLRSKSNISILIIQNCERSMQQLNMELTSCKVKLSQCTTVVLPRTNCNCGLLHEQMKTQLELVESNFTQTTQRMTMEREQILKEKEFFVLTGIHLRRDKSILEKETENLKQMLEDKFSQFLGSVSGVSKALLDKIESLFPQQIAFQLTCPKQREHLEQIHTNCTSLSREVEDKLQHYLNSIRDQVSNMQAEDSHLKAENWRLSEDYRLCNKNSSSIIEQNKRRGEEIQQKHDQDKERLLLDKMKLNGEIDVLRNNVRFKSAEVDHLKEQLKQLNMSCMIKTGLGVQGARPITPNQNVWNPLGGGGSSSSSSTNLGLGSTGLGGPGSSFSSGSAFNKLMSHGAGSSGSTFQSSGSSSSLSNTGSGFDKPASPGGGQSSSSFMSSGSSSSLSNPGSGYSKPGSAGGASSSFGSLGSSLGSSDINKPAERERSSASIGSVGSNPNMGSSEIGSNKPTSGVRGSSAFSLGSAGSSGPAGSVGSASKSGSTSSGFPWFVLGNSNSGQSKTGSVPGRTSTGTGSGGSGSSFGGGRTSGLTGGPGSVSQHIQELQRLINPPGPQDKQDLSRMLG